LPTNWCPRRALVERRERDSVGEHGLQHPARFGLLPPRQHAPNVCRASAAHSERKGVEDISDLLKIPSRNCVRNPDEPTGASLRVAVKRAAPIRLPTRGCRKDSHFPRELSVTTLRVRAFAHVARSMRGRRVRRRSSARRPLLFGPLRRLTFPRRRTSMKRLLFAFTAKERRRD
jgi:hypothetical protein